MISRVHDRLGTAGLIVAIIALVAAVGGSAYAASKNPPLSGKQKKEVQKLAAKYAGKPGANGTNGSNGAAGAKGDKGDPGTAGTPGTNGVDGKSPVGTTFTGSKGTCNEGQGGVEYNGASKNFVCNGKEGSPWTPGTLPSGKTETGSFSDIVKGEALIPISWSIPLTEGLGAGNVHIVEGAATADCPGSAAEPKAEPGNLCVYVTIGFGATVIINGPFSSSAPQADIFETPVKGSGTSGALLYAGSTEAAIWGTFAVTAP